MLFERAVQTSGVTPQQAQRWLLRIGALLGVGTAGTLDEVIFHQLLQWHNFYVHTTAMWRIVSDGLFHIFSSVLVAVGTMLFWSQRERLATVRDGRALGAGLLIGAGGFNLYDGIIQHKLLQLHPVREGVENILPYDLAWNAVALLVLALGVLLWRAAQRQPATAAAP